MGRIGRGWQLTKQSWAVIKGDRSLLIFPIVAGVCALITSVVFFGIGAGVGASTDSFWAALPFLIIGLYALIAIGQFFAVALASCATAALDGHDTTFSQGFNAAREKLGIILAWSAVLLVVGGIISALQSLIRDQLGGIAGAIFGGLANFAWTVATFFVVPVIALDGLGPKEAIKRSTSLIKARWGEGVVGSATIGGAVFLLGILPAIGLIALGVFALDSVAPVGVLLIALGVIVLVIASLLQSALTAVFRVALYRFATEGDHSVGVFTQEQLAGAFKPKSGRGRTALFSR
jgi:hypothetical protein